MTMPDKLHEECFDTVLVDAHKGFQPNHPGWQEAAYWAKQMAKRCMKDTKRSVYTSEGGFWCIYPKLLRFRIIIIQNVL